MSAQSAITCFNDNIKSGCNPQDEPEKYNLYRGLGEMAEAIKDLEQEITAIKNIVDRIQRKVG